MGDRITVAEHEALGIPFPPADERAALLEETALAMRTLFAGRPWGGGDQVGPISGPLLPPADVAVWLGGRSERVLDAAARAGDGWNGWGLSADAFAERAESLAVLAREANRDPTELTVSWGGIVLVGQDAADLAALEADRVRGGLPMDVWRGTADDLRRFAGALGRAGASWFICVPAGPADRLEVVAESLRRR
jgi:alkanesulfonate monooxygenase SsuD/methylene tetrahydromethanopterin reductase-like flavin-dependent oxidoreductase (luciferase family)